jgi:L-fuconolactonase
MRIDAHQHFWTYDPLRHGWIDESMKAIRRDFLPIDLEPELKKAGIDGTVAVQADETDAETEFLLGLAEENAFILSVVGWVDLKGPDTEARLQALKAHRKLSGFRSIMQGRSDEEYLSNKSFLHGVGLLKRYGYRYDLLVYHDQMGSLLRFTDRFPEQPFMLDHLGKPPIAEGGMRRWREEVRVLARHPHTYCKLSGMVTEARRDRWTYNDLVPYMETAAEFFGTDRLCFGSDWPVCLTAADYATVTETVMRFLSQVDEAERERVMGLNAKQFYGI